MAIKWEQSTQGLKSTMVNGAIGLWHLQAYDDEDDEFALDAYLMKSVIWEEPDYTSFIGLKQFTPISAVCYKREE